MTQTTIARTMTEEYRQALDAVVVALRRAGAIRFDLPQLASVPTTPSTDAKLRRLAERAVAMLDENTLHMARAEAIHDALGEDDDLVTLAVFARRAIDAYEARVR